jgi:peptidoglycan/LPS O-acetylase OafA/YrhL
VWLLIAAVVGLFLTGPVFGFYSRFAAYFEGHLAVLLICLVAYRADLPGCGLLDMRPVRMVGLASGAYYVLHPLLLIVLAPMIELLIPVGLSATAPAIVGAIAIACCMVGIIPVALLGYYLIEASGIELGRRVIHRIGLAR